MTKRAEILSDGDAEPERFDMEEEEEDPEEDVDDAGLLDNAAVAENDGDDDDEEDDEDDQDEYEKDDFVVDVVEEEEEDGGEEHAGKEKRKKKKRRRSGRNFDLDQDDYELLEESNAIGHRERRRIQESKRFKRLKRMGRDSDLVDHSGFSDGEGELLDEDVPEELGNADEEDVEDVSDDGMRDFIVDDIDPTNDTDTRRKMIKTKVRGIAGVPASAMEEALAIFGDVDQLLMIRSSAQSVGPDGQMRKRVEDEVEPSILEEKYLTEKDKEIRKMDLPERIKISEDSSGTPSVEEEHLREESSWILSQLPSNMIPWRFLQRTMKQNDQKNGGIDSRENEGANEGANGGVNEGSDGGADERTDGVDDEKIALYEQEVVMKEKFKEDIVRFLRLHHVEKFDIPFISMYRKEQCLSLLEDPELLEAENDEEVTPKLKWNKVLWAIKELDTKWLLLQKRKRTLHLYYETRYEDESSRVYDEARLALNQQLFESIVNSLKDAESDREVDDVNLKFNLHFPPYEASVGKEQYKRPNRTSAYSTCSKAGLWEVAGKFGCSAEQFGLHITVEKVGAEALIDLRESPMDIASNFKCAMFETPEAVLKGARYMAAMEISSEPRVRKYVRKFFMENAVVSTAPTSVGNTSIDSGHPIAGVKWLHEKPLTKFEESQWLLIEKAEKEKLLKVTISLTGSKMVDLLDETNFYLSDGVSIGARSWNEQRKLVLEDAFLKHLLPSMEKEARTVLTSRARKWVLMQYGKQLWNRVSVAPYRRKELERTLGEENAPRVLACCWGPGNPATTFVMLDSSGELLDILYAGSLGFQSKQANLLQRKKVDEQRLLKFMTDHQPHIVVLGAANLFVKRLKEEIYEIIYKMVEENPQDLSREMDGISIVYGDESLPRIYEHSRISSEQLCGRPGIVKRAVALGRYLQNPLAMVSTLCGPGREILSWNLGSLDHFLSDDEKFEIIEQVMVDITNQVGVDVNLAACNEWLFASLQFVSGLGPRKAMALKMTMIKAGCVTSRKELADRKLTTLKVFINAIGFLRVRCSGMVPSTHYMDLLDDTRIHPESYGLAKVMSAEIYKMHAHNNLDEDEIHEIAIEYCRDHPEQLKSFVVDEYAKDYEKANYKNKRETLNDIKMELLHGFQDWRTPFKELNPEEEFYLVSGENVDSLVEGKIVQVKVQRVQTDRAICVLESGLTGMLHKNNYADQACDIDLTTEIQEGDVLTCKIREIQKNRYLVNLTCKDSELNRQSCQISRDVDSYYQENWTTLPGQQDKSCKPDLVKKNFKQRMIVHPHFQNITVDEAIKFLSDKDAGQTVIYPSSKGPYYLNLTLKMHDGVFAHKEIIEGGKGRDVTRLLCLGTTLRIGDEKFEDLDEVMDRYVDGLVTHLKSMLSHRKFKRGSKAEVDGLLKVEKSNYPMRIVYCFGICYEHPGAFILSYIRNTNPHHEYISLYPSGFKFRKRMFNNVDRLLAYFQKHIDDIQNESVPSIQSVSATVPMRSSSHKISSPGMAMDSGSEKNTGGWGAQSNIVRDISAPGLTAINNFVHGGAQVRHPSGLPRPNGQDAGWNQTGNNNWGVGGNSSGWGMSGGGNGDGNTRRNYDSRFNWVSSSSFGDGNQGGRGGRGREHGSFNSMGENRPTQWGLGYVSSNLGDNKFAGTGQSSACKEGFFGGWSSSGNSSNVTAAGNVGGWNSKGRDGSSTGGIKATSPVSWGSWGDDVRKDGLGNSTTGDWNCNIENKSQGAVGKASGSAGWGSWDKVCDDSSRNSTAAGWNCSVQNGGAGDGSKASGSADWGSWGDKENKDGLGNSTSSGGWGGGGGKESKGCRGWGDKSSEDGVGKNAIADNCGGLGNNNHSAKASASAGWGEKVGKDGSRNSAAGGWNCSAEKGSAGGGSKASGSAGWGSWGDKDRKDGLSNSAWGDRSSDDGKGKSANGDDCSGVGENVLVGGNSNHSAKASQSAGWGGKACKDGPRNSTAGGWNSSVEKASAGGSKASGSACWGSWGGDDKVRKDGFGDSTAGGGGGGGGDDKHKRCGGWGGNAGSGDVTDAGWSGKVGKGNNGWGQNSGAGREGRGATSGNWGDNTTSQIRNGGHGDKSSTGRDGWTSTGANTETGTRSSGWGSAGGKQRNKSGWGS